MFGLYLLILFVGGWTWFLCSKPSAEAILGGIAFTAVMIYATVNNL